MLWIQNKNLEAIKNDEMFAKNITEYFEAHYKELAVPEGDDYEMGYMGSPNQFEYYFDNKKYDPLEFHDIVVDMVTFDDDYYDSIEFWNFIITTGYDIYIEYAELAYDTYDPYYY